MLLQGRLQDQVLQMSLFTASMHSFFSKMWPSGKMEMEHLGEMKLPEVSKFGPHPMAESKSKAVRHGIDTIRGCNQEVEDGKHPTVSMMSQQVLKPRSPSSLLAPKVQGRVFTSGHRRGGNVRPSVRSIVRAHGSSSDEVSAVSSGRMGS